MKDFQYLLQRFKDNTATPEELDEFFLLVQSGRYDDALAEAVGTDLFSQQVRKSQASDRKKIIHEKLLQQIDAYESGAKVIPIRMRKQNAERSRSIFRFSAAAAVAILAVASFFLYQTQTIPNNQLSIVPVTLTFEGKRYVALPDGSTVKLNADSKLVYTANDSARALELIGEAFFDVAHDDTKPFTVHSRGIETKVLGTAFNIRAYPDDKEVAVTVSRGKVQVGDGTKIFDVLTPDHAMFINPTTQQVAKTELKADVAITWTKKFFVLDDVSLDSAAMMIGERFKTNVVLENPALKNCRVYAMFLEGESLKQVLDVITPPVNATYQIENGTVKLSGTGCGSNSNNQ